jgi:hypothetical protein
VLSEILTKAPVAPVRLNPEVPAGLSAVIGKTLEKEREARYPSAADLRADLDQLHRDPKSFPVPAPRTFRRTSFRALAAVLLVLLGVGLWFGKDLVHVGPSADSAERRPGAAPSRVPPPAAWFPHSGGRTLPWFARRRAPRAGRRRPC